MKRIVLNPIALDFERIEQALEKEFTVQSSQYPLMKALLEEGWPFIRAKAIIKECVVSVPNSETVVVEEAVFTSRLLFDKLFHCDVVYLNIVTAGDELDVLSPQYPEVLMDRLKYAILTEGRRSVKNYISKVFGCNNLAELSPGSLPDWPVNSNHVLFDLLGQGDEIGVVLKEDGFMAPLNSVSGILYTGDKDFVNCSLCKKLDCIGRKDLFNEAEYKRIFQI